MTAPIHIAIVGAAGRMGQSLLENAHRADDLLVAAAIVAPGTGEDGIELGPSKLVATTSLADEIEHCDAVIDFSSPESCLKSAQIAARAQTPFVSGTTGLSELELNQLRELSDQCPILLASNFSVGVNVLERLVELASRSCGEDFDIEIFESHHRFKVDAPSGTALYLGKAAARGRGLSLEDSATWARHGNTGAREANTIGFQVLRGGDIVGEHTVFLCADGERIELTHRATDRGIFARGALRAARWLVTQPPGWYSMQDVLF